MILVQPAGLGKLLCFTFPALLDPGKLVSSLSKWLQ